MIHFGIPLQDTRRERLVGELGELHGQNSGDELRELDGVGVVSVELVEDSASLVIRGGGDTEPWELTLEGLKGKRVLLLLISGGEAVPGELDEGNDLDEGLKANPATVSGISHNAQRTVGGIRELVVQLTEGLRNSTDGDSAILSLGVEGVL